MKKILIILGGIFAVLIVAGTIGFSVILVKGKALEKKSKAYVDKVTPTILANLDNETLFSYASDELKDSASPTEFDKILKMSNKTPNNFIQPTPNSYFSFSVSPLRRVG